MVVVGNHRSRKKQDEIAGDAHQDIEPEDTVVVVVLRLLQVADGTLETALLQGCGNQLEDQYHGCHAIVMRRQQTSQNDAEQQAQSLLYHIIHAAPE